MGKSKITVPQNNNQKNKMPTNKFVALDSDYENSDEELQTNQPSTQEIQTNQPSTQEIQTDQHPTQKSVNVQELAYKQESKQSTFASKLINGNKDVPWQKKFHKEDNTTPRTFSSFKDSGKKYGDHNKSYGDHNKSYGDHNKSYGDHNKSYGDHNKSYGDHNKSYKSTKDFSEQKESKDPKKPSEVKKLYIEPTEYCEERENELGNTKFLNSPWTVWIHKANVGPEIENWTEDTYTCIYVINSIGSFWRFFTNFQMLDKINYQYFIMRNKIKPIWEDNDNRNGSICSFRVEYGPCAMTCMSLLIMNETFMTGNDDINGISYSIKQKSILIKVWYKIGTNKVVDKIPIEFMNKLDAFIKNNDKFGKRDNSSITIRYSRIDPKYTLEG